MDRTEKVLKSVTEAFGPSGFEEEIRSLLKKEFEKNADEILTDNLGSLIAVKKGKKDRPRIAFFAHMDEIGLMVKGFTESGYIKFAPLGGWWSPMLIGQKVKVKTKKGDFEGVIGSTPPHLLKEEERKQVPKWEDLYIDFGVDEKFLPKEKLGIQIGTPVVPVSEFKVLGNNKVYTAKAFDDRVSCALLVRILDEIKNLMFEGTVYLVATVQEEVGLRGAATSPWVIEPDIGIALDVSIAEDTPGIREKSDAKMGNGASIVVLDATMVAHRKLRDFIIEIAKKNKIPHHLTTVTRGGYDTGRVHMFKQGVPSSIIGIPSRYIHGFHSMIHRKDFDSALKLNVALVKKLTQKNWKRIVKV